MIVERKTIIKKKKIGLLKRKYAFERVEYFKYLGVILNEDNNNQIDLQERIEMLTKHILCYTGFLKRKTHQRK
jgi:hypothetical protein